MNIPLDKILPSPHPLRTSWDEDKMAELAQSVKEQGVIVPIKVRPTDTDLCEIIYGHRRVEAARRAGLKEIPAVVEGVDDTDALIQALIENVQREDMEPQDIYDSAVLLMAQKGWSSFKQLAEHGVLGPGKADRISKFGGLASDVRVLVGNQENRPLTYRHVDLAAKGVGKGHEPVYRDDILRKAADEQLNADQTGDVAEAVYEAEDEAEREAILDTDYHDPTFQRLVRVKSAVKRETARRERRERQENPREVAEYIKALQDFTGKVTIAVKVAEYGKFSPEAVAFVNGWHDSLRRRLAELEQAMEDYNAKVQD